MYTYVYVYIYMNIYMHIYMYMYGHICLHVYLCIYIQTYVHIHIYIITLILSSYVYMNMYLYVKIHICMYLYMYMYLCMYMYLYKHIYVYIYIHIHTLDIFRKYFEDHGEKFVNAPEMCGGEHNMEYYSLFQDYLLVYENTLTDYLETIDCTVEELYSEVRECQGDSTGIFNGFKLVSVYSVLQN
jgi:hypothetical protein